MSDTETKTREQELMDEFKDGLDKDAAPQLAKRIAELEADRDAERARADKAEKTAKSAKAKVAASPAPKLRTIKAGDDAVDDIAAAIANADRVEVAFSDGRGEIEGVDAVTVEGEAWRAHPTGQVLAEPVTLNGPAPGAAAVQVKGYALILDGKQVAYRERPDPITLVPGQTYKIENDIIF